MFFEFKQSKQVQNLVFHPYKPVLEHDTQERLVRRADIKEVRNVDYYINKKDVNGDNIYERGCLVVLTGGESFYARNKYSEVKKDLNTV